MEKKDKKLNEIDERTLEEGVARDKMDRGIPLPEVQLLAFQCGGCKSNLLSIQSKEDFQCYFCGKKDPKDSNAIEEVRKPDGILPFNIPRKTAYSSLKKWLSKGRFYPADIATQIQESDLKATFVPFWLVDVHVRALLKDKLFAAKDAEDKKEVVHYYEENFKKNILFTSKVIKHDLIYRTKFEWDHIVPFDPEYMGKDFACELYHKGGEIDFLKELDKIIDKEVSETLKKEATDEKDYHIIIEKTDKSIKHALVPFYLALYNYNGKKHLFWVNGENGDAGGVKPFSRRKIIIVLITIISLLILLTLGIDLNWFSRG